MLPMCTLTVLSVMPSLRDLLVGQALGGQPEHLLLPVAEQGGWGRLLLAGRHDIPGNPEFSRRLVEAGPSSPNLSLRAGCGPVHGG